MSPCIACSGDISAPSKTAAGVLCIPVASFSAVTLWSTDIRLQMVEMYVESLATCLLSGEHCAAQAAITVEKYILDNQKHFSLNALWIHIFWHVVSLKECSLRARDTWWRYALQKGKEGRLRQPLGHKIIYSITILPVENIHACS